MPDSTRAQDHENRSRAIADSLRRFLVGLHTGGIGLVALFAAEVITGAQNDQMIDAALDSFVGPILVFTLGLLATGYSMQLAKHRETQRRDAALAGKSDPTFPLRQQSMTWEYVSLALFAAGVLCALAHWW